MSPFLRAFLALAVLAPAFVWACVFSARALDVSEVWLLAPALVLVAGIILFRYQQAQLLNELDQRGVLLLNRGELEAAAQIFDEGAERAKRKGLVQFEQLFRLHRAAVWTRAGEPRRALEILLPLFAGGHHARGLWTQRVQMVMQAALAHALLGELDETRQLLDSHTPRIAPEQRVFLAHAQVVLLARSGAPDQALALMDERWKEIEAAFPSRSVRLLQVLRAMCFFEKGHTDAARRALDAAGDEGIAASEYMRRQWPELERFLGRHDSYRTVSM